jgi:SET domain-containing protein
MSKLFEHPNLYVTRSPIQGYGVFTDSFIPANTIIEECHYVDVCNAEENNNACIRHRFCYPMQKPTKYVVCFGKGSVFNHSNEPNAFWYIDFEKDVFVFKTTKNIFANQEVLVYYGDGEYWKNTNG